MPFAFSHPAIVLPLRYLPRKWFSLTGLVIGSLAPDFEYFLRMKIQSNYSHTLAGLFWFNLPLAILLAFIFHNIVRDSLFDNLPIQLKSRLNQFKQFDWNKYFKRNWFIVIISILIGAASHLFWDSFTHDHGYFVNLIPALKKNINLLGFSISIFKILQHSSTVIGALAISFALFKMPKDESVKPNSNLNYWIAISMLTLLIITIRIAGGLDYQLYGHLIATGISALLVSLILTPKLLAFKR